MDLSSFSIIGENIHCTRVYKRGGKYAKPMPGGGEGIYFSRRGQEQVLPIPDGWEKVSPPFADGKVKHVAVAVWQATEGDGQARQTAEAYLRHLAERQIDAGAAFLDVNVDEYHSDAARRAETMRWLVGFLAERFDHPLSIDSSSVEVMAAGLESCKDVGRPHMANSVSLDRTGNIELIARHGVEAVVSAAGAEDMPSTVDERLANFEKIISLLDEAGVPRQRMHLDPLVFPISTDPMHGKNFLETTRAALAKFDGVRLSGGFSNVSYGMPQRMLLNRVFVRLCIEAGATSGIMDPVSMPLEEVMSMDMQSEPVRLAADFLTGQDLYGMEFISAHRAGKLG